MAIHPQTIVKLTEISATLERAADVGDVFAVSIGSSCGPAIRLREAGLQRLGRNFFDNIVCPVGAATDLIANQFTDLLTLDAMGIGSYEGVPSATDKRYGINFHHDFVVANHEGAERVTLNGIRNGIASVRARYHYLADKFVMIAQSSARKNFYLRAADGSAFAVSQIHALDNAIRHIGGRNFEVIGIYGTGEPAHGAPQYFLPEIDERWGAAAAWAKVAATVNETRRAA